MSKDLSRQADSDELGIILPEVLRNGLSLRNAFRQFLLPFRLDSPLIFRLTERALNAVY